MDLQRLCVLSGIAQAKIEEAQMPLHTMRALYAAGSQEKSGEDYLATGYAETIIDIFKQMAPIMRDVIASTARKLVEQHDEWNNIDAHDLLEFVFNEYGTDPNSYLGPPDE